LHPPDFSAFLFLARERLINKQYKNVKEKHRRNVSRETLRTNYQEYPYPLVLERSWQTKTSSLRKGLGTLLFSA
jgi:hypothetical protein